MMTPPFLRSRTFLRSPRRFRLGSIPFFFATKWLGIFPGKIDDHPERKYDPHRYARNDPTGRVVVSYRSVESFQWGGISIESSLRWRRLCIVVAFMNEALIPENQITISA